MSEAAPGRADTPTTADSGANVAGLESGWKKAVVWWDIAFYAVLALTAVTVALAPDARGDRPGVTLGAIAVLLVAYLALGRPAARTRRAVQANAYLVILVIATGAAISQTTIGAFLLFAAFSQIWMLAERTWHGVAFSVALAVAMTVGFAWADGFSTSTVLENLPQMAIVLVFSVGLGLWVASSMRRTETLARTLDELEATREALAEAHRAEGVAAERERVAREIHDTLAQGFTSIVMLSQAVRADVEHDRTGPALERLGLVEHTARENLAEARGLVAAFAPVGLTEDGLGAALERLAARFGAETSVRVDVALPASIPEVGREREVILLRAAQEALTNIRRHAEARAVRLALTVTDGGAVELEVSDDGRGIDPEVVEGFGLRGMRDRVTSGGGELEVAARHEGGTRVVVALPPGTVGA